MAHTDSKQAYFTPFDPFNTPYAARLLGNLLLYSDQLNRTPELNDPELEFLLDCSGFGLLICSAAYGSGSPKPLREHVLQQEEAYGILSEALHRGTEEKYFAITAELENQLVALLIPRNKKPLSEDDFSRHLSEILDKCLGHLTEQRRIPVYSVYSLQPELKRLSHSYIRMKNAIVFLNYIESGAGILTRLAELETKGHIGLWNQMEAGSMAFAEAFIQDDASAAQAQVDEIIEAILAWIPPSKDSLMTDIQYYFDTILNRLSSRFGNDVIQGVSVTEAIFESTSLPHLRENLREVVQAMFRNMQKKASKDTRSLFLDVQNYIDEHIRDYTLSAGSTAAHFGLSPQLLSIQFKKCFGVTPSHYIELRRIELIQQDLISTDLPIEKICHRVGMGSVSTLHRVFQKHCGQSPGAFRRNAKSI